MEAGHQKSDLTLDQVQRSTNRIQVLFTQGVYAQEVLAQARCVKSDDSHPGIPRTTMGHVPLPLQPFISNSGRVELSDLALAINQIHWGKYLIVQTISAAGGNGMDVEVAVTDHKGTLAMRLALHNYSFVEKSVLELNFDEILPLGSYLMLKNPLFATTPSGFLMLHCANPADVELISGNRVETRFDEFLSYSEFPKSNDFYLEKQDFWNFEEDEVTFGKLKGLGNKGFGDKRFSDAERYYDMALEYCAGNMESIAIIYSNKSAALLGLGAFNAAMKCAEAALEINPEYEKHIYRKTKAFIGLRKYEEGLKFLEGKFGEFSSLSNSRDCKSLLEIVKVLASRQNLGPTDSQLLSIRMGTLSKDEALPEFTGPLAPISQNGGNGNGRGLVATQDIRTGQLLLCVKAFGYQATSPGSNRYRKNSQFETPDQEQVIGKIANKLALEPELLPEFYNLPGGPKLTPLNPGDWRFRHVDMARVTEIVKANAFGSGNMLSDVEGEKDFSGLWMLPSLFNHNCSEHNCVWVICGEWMTVTAITEIKKGEELTMAFIQPIGSFEERQNFFKSHGFICNCKLCQLEAAEPILVNEEREEILASLGAIKLDARPAELNKGLKAVTKLISLRKDNVPLNFPLLTPQVFRFVQILSKKNAKNRQKDVISVLTRLFEVASSSVCWHNEGISLGINLLYYQAQKATKRNTKLTKEWMATVKALVLKFYGNLDRMKEAAAVGLLKEKFDIDFFKDD